MLKGSFDLPVLFDLGATFAFALTGALAAIRRHYDIVGVLALALVSGIGGAYQRRLLKAFGSPGAALGASSGAISAARAPMAPTGTARTTRSAPATAATPTFERTGNVVMPGMADVERAQMLVESPSRARLQAFLAAWHGVLHATRAGPAGTTGNR